MRENLARMFGAVALAAALALTLPLSVRAQEEGVADVRAQVSILNDQIGQLREELVRRSAANGLPADPATALARLDQLEAELRRLTDRVDVLTNDIGRIVEDASNRVGDIEFRLMELEGGDPGVQVQPAPQLGGGLSGPRPRPSSRETTGAAGTLAVAEQSDFDAAIAAADTGDNARAAELFGSFLETYPGGPLTTDAQYRRGDALAATGNWQEAARSYLNAFSGEPQSRQAPRALMMVGVSLGRLGQASEACLTLDEVDSRFPNSDVAGEVAAEKRTLGCQ